MGAASITGSAAFTLGALTLASTGTVGSITGSAAFTLGALTLVSAAELDTPEVEEPVADSSAGSSGARRKFKIPEETAETWSLDKVFDTPPPALPEDMTDRVVHTPALTLTLASAAARIPVPPLVAPKPVPALVATTKASYDEDDEYEELLYLVAMVI